MANPPTPRPPLRLALEAPTGRDALLLALAVTAVSTSGPLMAATAAPALAIAFWRNAMATGVLLPIAVLRVRGEIARLSGRQWRLIVVAAALLAAHFAAWVSSLTYTTVASATALVTVQPVWAALLARVGGAHIPARAWVGIAIAVIGAGALTGVDLRSDPDAITGNLLALLGGALAAGYMTAGSAVRRDVSTTAYTVLCYGLCAAILLGACLLLRLPLLGYAPVTWLQLAAITSGAQLIGHSLFNRLLQTTSPTVLSLAILLEVPGSAVLAAVFLQQVPPPMAFPAALLVLVGVAVVIRASSRRR